MNLLESLHNEGYITGVEFPSAVGSIRGAKIYDARITQKGIEFLEDNSRMKKAAEFLRAVKDTIPGL